MRHFTRVIVLTALLTACTDIISPPRVEYYEYRRLVLDGEGEPFAMAFHWPRASLPIRVWVGEDDPLRPATLRAISIWEDALLYGEIRFELVGDPSLADIVVHNERVPESVLGNVRLGTSLDGCRGETVFEADIEAGTLTPPFDVWVWTTSGTGNPDLPTCYEITVLHEFGHALGIFEHAPSPDDLMYADPVRNTLSERDRATVEAAYHLPATLRPRR